MGGLVDVTLATTLGSTCDVCLTSSRLSTRALVIDASLSSNDS